MRILITGAGGLVGGALTRVGGALTRHFRSPHEIFPLRHRDLDITDGPQVVATVAAIKPDLIINCAVMGVDECERDPEQARRLNVDGPALLARAASRLGAEIMHFSTNYV